jgi:hypothetical protein
MSNEQINILIGTGQFLLALLIFFGLDAKWIKRLIGQMDRKSKWPILLILGGLTFSGYGYYRTMQPVYPATLTPSDIETRVKTWLEASRASVKKIEDNPKSHFILEATLENGHRVTIFQPVQRDHFLVIETSVGVDRGIDGSVSSSLKTA